MIIIGVTGQMGSGKSTVSMLIKNATGAVVVDADKIAREYMAPGKEAYEAALRIFGKTILYNRRQANKWRVNRLKFADILFHDDEKRAEFNKTTFRLIGERTKQMILENPDKEFVVLDFPLLYEGGFDKLCNCVIGVFADEETKIRRLDQRPLLTREGAMQRLSKQMSEEKLRELVDYNVENSRDRNYIALSRDVTRLIEKIRKDEEEKRAKNESI
ncbi:MAG: dephospho-CoA kinase [Clostridia bacterium]|nr:dephospho-CoA kinase [Clostridia bacterium]